MIARLFYLVILKMGYLLFFSGGNEIRHFIALLRSYRGTLYIYIDLNMVRARAVEHPNQWVHGGYREIL